MWVWRHIHCAKDLLAVVLGSKLLVHTLASSTYTVLRCSESTVIYRPIKLMNYILKMSCRCAACLPLESTKISGWILPRVWQMWQRRTASKECGLLQRVGSQVYGIYPRQAFLQVRSRSLIKVCCALLKSFVLFCSAKLRCRHKTRLHFQG